MVMLRTACHKLHATRFFNRPEDLIRHMLYVHLKLFAGRIRQAIPHGQFSASYVRSLSFPEKRDMMAEHKAFSTMKQRYHEQTKLGEYRFPPGVKGNCTLNIISNFESRAPHELKKFNHVYFKQRKENPEHTDAGFFCCGWAFFG